MTKAKRKTTVVLGPWVGSTTSPVLGPSEPVWPNEHELFAHLQVDHGFAPHGLDDYRLGSDLERLHEELHEDGGIATPHYRHL